MTYLERIVNAETGETTERPYTADEITAVQQAKAEAETEAQAASDKAATRESVLRKLGLSENDLAALIG